MKRLILPVLLAACAPPAEDGRWVLEDGGWLHADAQTNVLRQFSFTVAEDGVAPGFDLDGRVSEAGELETCGHADLTSPQGEEGVDNQLAAVWTTMAPLVGDAVEALVQGSINEGRFLLMIELVGVDDLLNDDDVTLNLFRGRADPDLGTFGLIAPDQTFYVHPEHAPTVVEGVQIIDGHLRAGPVAFDVPVDILEANFPLAVREGMVELDILDDGTFLGHLGGAMSVSEFMGEMLATNAREEAQLVQPLFENNADMGFSDGGCDLFSTAFAFEGTTGFVVRYDE